MKKFICLLIAIICTMSFVACTPSGTGSGGPGGGDNSTKSELRVAVIDSGLGTEFAKEYKKDFEEYYKGTSFEDGKMGVTVTLVPGLSEYASSTLIDTMSTLDTTVYILDDLTYRDFVTQDRLVDITDIATEKIYDEDGNFAEDTGKDATLCIEDMMAEGYSEFSRKVDGKIYGIPFRASVGGIIYDADMFNEEALFLDANNKVGATFADIEAGNCSTGPDGVLGTYDDGLPNTMADFAYLMKEIAMDPSRIPFCFSGKYSYIRNGAFQAIHANYEGYDNFMLNYTFDGYDTGLNKQISPSNYIDLLEQNGRKAGIRFFEEIYKQGAYSANSKASSDQTQAQKEFIESVEAEKRIAMFMEGGYWESESRKVFDDMGAFNPDYGYGKRDFRLMAIPRFVGDEWVPDQVNTQQILRAAAPHGTNIVLSKYNTSPNPEVALKIGKKFVQFINRRDQLIDFTKNTGGCVRCVEVPTDYTEAELNSLTKYGRSIYEYLNDGARLAYTIDLADLRFNNPKSFVSGGDWNWGFACSIVGGAEYGDPLSAFMLSTNTPTRNDVFSGMLSFTKLKFTLK